jgi:hypothetical protein
VKQKNESASSWPAARVSPSATVSERLDRPHPGTRARGPTQTHSTAAPTARSSLPCVSPPAATGRPSARTHPAHI